ncbi:MAG: ABC transporter ATP-binding protein [Acidimicrobiales bacterium]
MAKSSVGESIWFIGRMVRPHWVPFTVAVTGGAVFAAGAVLSAVLLGRLVDDVILPVFDQGDDIAMSTVLGWGALLLGIVMIRIIGVVGRRYFAGMTAERVSRGFRRDLAHAYVRLPMSFYQRRSAGDLLAHVDTDSDTVTEVLHPLPFAFAAMFMAAFAAIAMFLVDPLLALLAFAIFPISIVMNRVYTDRVEGPATEQQASVGKVAAVAHESFDGALVVKLLGREQAEIKRFNDEAEELRQHRVRVGTLRAVFESTLGAVPNLGIVLVVLIGAWRVESGDATVGGLIQIAALFATLSLPLRILGYFLQNVPIARAASARLHTVLDEPFAAPGAGNSLADTPADLRFENVTLGFGDQVIVSDVDLEVRAGETVALVGATGSGKSTLVSALAGLLEPQAGTITFGGIPIDDLDPAMRADSIRIAFQEAFLFGDTIDANVGLERSGIDRQQIDVALVTAGADGFVGALPAATSTIVGERGMTLSGGQRQRVALARALAGQPRLVVLDDATSAVDAAIERQILDALRAGDHAPSMLIVAHRLSTIRLADRIVFVKQGRIAGRGTHEELLADPDYLALATAYEDAEAENV